MYKDALYVAGMILLNEKALEVKEVGKRRSESLKFLVQLFVHCSLLVFTNTATFLLKTNQREKVGILSPAINLC